MVAYNQPQDILYTDAAEGGNLYLAMLQDLLIVELDRIAEATGVSQEQVIVSLLEALGHRKQ